MKNLKIYEWLRLNKSGYTIAKQAESQLRKVSGIPYDTGTTDYLEDQKLKEESLYKNRMMDEKQLREEFRQYRYSLQSPFKSQEIQRLLNSRVVMTTKRGVVVRDSHTGMIQYIESFQRESYNDYLNKAKTLNITSTLLEKEYNSTVIYTNMIDEAEGRSFLARARVENLEELSNILKK